jgi:hypothetical protein
MTRIVLAMSFVLTAHHSRYSPHTYASKIIYLKINPSNYTYEEKLTENHSLIRVSIILQFHTLAKPMVVVA